MKPCVPCGGLDLCGCNIFFRSFKRDYVWQDLCETFKAVESKIPGWIEDYNTTAPHSALKMLTPVEFFENWKLKNRK